MAYQATNWAWDLDLPMTQKFVLVALADMADESMSCFPGQKRLARMVGGSERTVRRALSELEELGLIEREERRAKDGYRTSDRYVLKTKKKLTGHIGRKSKRTESPRTISPTSPDTDITLTGQSDRALSEPPENHQKESPDDLFELEQPLEGDRFEEFWTVWPRKDGKKAAAESWVKALKKINQHALIMAATAYSTSPYRPERKFVPFASTWLNQERWSDGPPVAPERSRGTVENSAQAARILEQRRAQRDLKAVGS